ncbi:hypothetical protein KC357_g223 [Hortaea werneckii]|nr:hypothetical protein KC357_g223 [Hortaea werneckii]
MDNTVPAESSEDRHQEVIATDDGVVARFAAALLEPGSETLKPTAAGGKSKRGSFETYNAISRTEYSHGRAIEGGCLRDIGALTKTNYEMERGFAALTDELKPLSDTAVKISSAPYF